MDYSTMENLVMNAIGDAIVSDKMQNNVVFDYKKLQEGLEKVNIPQNWTIAFIQQNWDEDFKIDKNYLLECAVIKAENINILGI